MKFPSTVLVMSGTRGECRVEGLGGFSHSGVDGIGSRCWSSVADSDWVQSA